jgi:hypothetical protein
MVAPVASVRFALGFRFAKVYLTGRSGMGAAWARLTL